MNMLGDMKAQAEKVKNTNNKIILKCLIIFFALWSINLTYRHNSATFVFTT